MSKVLFEQQGHIGIITLNNPAVLNALSESFMNDINEALDKAEMAKDL